LILITDQISSGPWFRSCQPTACSDPAQCAISNTVQLRNSLLESRPGLVGPDSPADALWQCFELAKPIRQSLFVGLSQTHSSTKLTESGISDPVSDVLNNLKSISSLAVMTVHYLQTPILGSGMTIWYELQTRRQRPSVIRTTLDKPCHRLVSPTSQNESSKHRIGHGQPTLRLSILATFIRLRWTCVPALRH
jgi:hypothetical protein